MANIFRSARATNPDPVAIGLRVQSNVQGTPIPIGCGLTRWSPILIDYEGFSATPVSSPGGKGGLAGASGKGNTGQYDYKASGLMLLGEGLVIQINTIFQGSYIDFLVAPSAQVQADLNAIGINTDDISYNNTWYNIALHEGTYTDTADAWWLAQFGSRALPYRGLAYFTVPNQGLGTSPSWPSLNIEALWSINSDIPALGADANPADWIEALLTNPDWGVPGFPATAIGDFDTARNYWRANGMMISLTLTSPTAANSHLKTLMEALNAEFRWSNGALDIVPYGDMPVSGNGYVYTPNVAPLYALGVDDFLPNQGSLGSSASGGKSFVAFQRAAVLDIPNKLQVEYLDRANLYNPVVIYQADDAAITVQKQLRLSDLKQNHFFNLGTAASTSVSLQLQRLRASLNQYQVTVGPQFIVVDVMDYMSLTEPALQLVNVLVIVTEWQENSDRSITLTFEEVPLTAGAPIYNRQASLGLARNANAPPGNVNTPYFFEPPDALGDGLALLIGLSGVTPANFGGCDVWISSDGSTYEMLGAFEGSTRMGVLTAPLASVAAASSGQTIDAANTLAVNLAESNGALLSVSPASFAALSTVSVVDNEVIAYETATLTGANAYSLTTLARGAYGSTIAAHASGAPFMRIDGGSAFVWNFPSSYIGQTVYFKFCAFNQFDNATQNLSDVGAYAYTVKGSALASALPSVTNLYSNYEAGFQKIYWDEITDFRSGIMYEIRQGPTWAGAVVITAQAHSPFIARGNATFWVAARCNPIAGLTVYSAYPASVTTTANALGYNVVAIVDEQALGWPGSFQNGIGVQGVGSNAYARLGGAANILADASILAETDILELGGIVVNTAIYYTSAKIIDVGYVAQASINATTLITGTPVGANILSITDFLNTPDLLSVASAALVNGWIEIRVAANVNDAFAASDEFSVSDAFAGAYTWSSWSKFVPGVYSGRAFQFRLALTSIDAKTIALALAFNYIVQVPNRVDHYQGVSIPATGLVLSFQPDGAAGPGAFNGGPAGALLPYVSVPGIGMQSGDTVVISNESLAGMTITITNGGVAVARAGVNIDVSGF